MKRLDFLFAYQEINVIIHTIVFFLVKAFVLEKIDEDFVNQRLPIFH